MRIFLILLMAIFLSSCTQNQVAKNLGGKMTVDLPPNKKLVNVTWKDDNLWYLVRDRTKDEQPDKYEFKEQSSFGLWEGTITIVEK